ATIALSSDLRLEPRPVAHLPLVRAIIDQLQIVEAVDEHVPMDPRSRVSEGECVALMLLNILEGCCVAPRQPPLVARSLSGSTSGSHGWPRLVDREGRARLCRVGRRVVGPQPPPGRLRKWARPGCYPSTGPGPSTVAFGVAEHEEGVSSSRATAGRRSRGARPRGRLRPGGQAPARGARGGRWRGGSRGSSRRSPGAPPARRGNGPSPPRCSGA